MKYEIKKEFRTLTNLMKDANIERPMHEIRLILSKLINKSELQIMTSDFIYLNKKLRKKFFKNFYQRILGKPTSRIVGKKEFYSRNFYINKFTLDPRPETEILVENILKRLKIIKKNKIKILDVGTGSGCIIISVFLESKKYIKNLICKGIDISEKALEIAKKNQNFFDLSESISFFKSNLFSNINEKFDMIICNPPYIKKKSIKSLPNSVRKYDPLLSLDGGEDGLVFYKKIAEQVNYFIKGNGYLFLEIGKGQEEEIIKIFSENREIKYEVVKDFSKINRCLIFQYQKNNLIKKRNMIS